MDTDDLLFVPKFHYGFFIQNKIIAFKVNILVTYRYTKNILKNSEFDLTI